MLSDTALIQDMAPERQKTSPKLLHGLQQSFLQLGLNSPECRGCQAWPKTTPGCPQDGPMPTFQMASPAKEPEGPKGHIYLYKQAVGPVGFAIKQTLSACEAHVCPVYIYIYWNLGGKTQSPKWEIFCKRCMCDARKPKEMFM